MDFSRPWHVDSSRTRNQTHVPCFGRRILTYFTTREVPKDLLCRIFVICYCCYSFAKSCLTVCYLMDCSTPGFPVLHCLPEFAQIHVSIGSVMLSSHLILCHPLLPFSSIFPNIWIFSSELALCIRWLSLGASTSALVLPMNIQVWSPCSPGVSQEFSSTTIWKQQFFGSSWGMAKKINK